MSYFVEGIDRIATFWRVMRVVKDKTSNVKHLIAASAAPAEGKLLQTTARDKTTNLERLVLTLRN